MFFPDHHHAFRVSQRQRSDQNGVDHAEDGRVRTNPQSEDRDNSERKTWRLSQQAQTEAQVRQEIAHGVNLGNAIEKISFNDARERQILWWAGKAHQPFDDARLRGIWWGVTMLSRLDDILLGPDRDAFAAGRRRH
jgi:hypothetical protein